MKPAAAIRAAASKSPRSNDAARPGSFARCEGWSTSSDARLEVHPLSAIHRADARRQATGDRRIEKWVDWRCLLQKVGEDVQEGAAQADILQECSQLRMRCVVARPEVME